MSLYGWLRSNAQYARRLANSGLQGASGGRDEFLKGKAIAPYLGESAQEAFVDAALGACIGILGACINRERRSVSRTVALGLVGGAIGFGAGMTWRTRSLAANIARGALKTTDAVRDERWIEKHPIDYA
jgi:hypothetical protein